MPLLFLACCCFFFPPTKALSPECLVLRLRDLVSLIRDEAALGEANEAVTLLMEPLPAGRWRLGWGVHSLTTQPQHSSFSIPPPPNPPARLPRTPRHPDCLNMISPGSSFRSNTLRIHGTPTKHYCNGRISKHVRSYGHVPTLVLTIGSLRPSVPPGFILASMPCQFLVNDTFQGCQCWYSKQ